MSKSRSGARRRAAAGLLAGALAVAGFALAPPAGAVDDVTTDRIAGTNRYGTAAAFAGQDEFAGATTAILATGENFPDALAASGLAGANAPAPIVLTESESFTDEARVALSELNSLDDVIIVGGTAAISDDVAEAVAEEGYSVTRIAGTDRYGTAADIANAMGDAGAIDGFNTALIASGEVFADALAGGPLSYATGMPILLVNTSGIPAETEQALDDANVEQVIILGGTARITDETESELETITGRDAIRVAGQDRFETAADIGRYEEATLNWAPETVVVANGLNFPDALAAGPFAGERQAPIVLTASVPDATCEYVDEVSNTLTTVIGAGGTAAVSEEDLAAVETCGETTDNDAATGGDTQTSELEGPELQSASVTGVDLDDLEIIVSYVFDTDLDEDSASEALFKLYNADTDFWADGNDNASATDADVGGETVDVTFQLTDYGVIDAKLAAVAEGAVEDEDGNPNPPQSVGIASVLDDGGTQFADLVSVAVTDEDDTGNTDEVTFTFSQPTSVTGRSFEIILEDGTDVTCTGAATDPDADETSEEITATCPIDQNNNDGDPVRGVVTTDFGPGDTLIESANIGSGDSDGPDLEEITTPDENEDLGDNEFLFTFDDDIDSPTALNADSFNLYYSHCGATTPCAVSGTTLEFDDDDFGADSVIVTFPADSNNDFLVGGFVREGAVNTAGIGGVDNQEASVRIESETFDTGEVAGPQLVSVEASIDETAGGSFDDFEVTYTFDKDIDDDVALTAGDFSVWFDNDDGETESLDMDDCDYDGDRSVVCTDDDDESDIGRAVVGAVAADAVESNAEYTVSDAFARVSDTIQNPEGSAAFTAPGFPEDEA